MGQAKSIGGMLLWLLLACNHDRVDLGGTGARGSTPPSRAMAGGRSFVPPAQIPTVAVPNIILPEPRNPEPPAALSGLQSRAELLPPISGGTLAVAADGSSAVVADPDRDVIYLVDVPKGSAKALQLPAASEPGRVVLDDLGQAHVVLRGTGRLARIRLATGELAQSEAFCQYPRGLAYHTATRRLHAACADGQLVTLLADDHSVLAREQHLNDLRDVVLRADGTPIVSRFRSAGLLMQSADVELEARPSRMPRPKVDANVPDIPQVSLVSTGASFAFRTVGAADGTLWMLHERVQQDVMQDDRYVAADERCGAVVQPALTHWDGAKLPVTLDSLQLNGLAAPAVDLAISADSRFIAITTPAAYAQRSSSVQLALLADLKLDARIRPEEELVNDARIACSKPQFVQVEQDGQAVAVAFDRDSRLYIQNRFPARLDVWQVIASGAPDVSLAATISKQVTLSDTDIRDAGHEWFHAELGKTRVSCAACHAEGLDDAHTWQSGHDGARRTPSLRGGLTQTAPFGWTGEHKSPEAAMREIIEERLDVHNAPADALAAMQRWLDRLPALSLQAAPAAASGKALFESNELGCNQCHSGPQLTNNQTLDVGTGGSFQVPTLRGLALRAPYMHDGCAKDLNALFTQPDCTRSGHAQLSQLDSDRALQVRAYLESL